MGDEARSCDTAAVSFQRHKDLIYGKLVNKSLADIDYSELAEQVYGQQYSSDVARRMMYGSCKTLQLLDEQTTAAAPDSILADLQNARLELQKERQRFFDQRREYNKLVSAEGRMENLYESLKRSADSLMDTVGDIYGKDTGLPYTMSANEAVLVFSDWHYGMIASNIFNTYDKQTCIDRVHAVTTNAIARIQTHGCRTLHVVVLGDLIHGAIHTGVRVASEELVCEQIMQVSEILAQSIDELSKYVDKLYVYITYGNHARTVQNKKDSIHRDNIERLIPWWLQYRMSQNDKVTVMPESDTEFISLIPAGHCICAAHGDLDTVRSATRLFPSLLSRQCGKNIEYIILGDKHHRESFDELGVTATLCGSLCGTDEYANGKRVYSEPSQLLLIVNPDYGVDAEYRLRCV